MGLKIKKCLRILLLLENDLPLVENKEETFSLMY